MRTYVPKYSSNVAKVEYDEATKEMHVTFKGNNRVYTHTGLTPEHFDAMTRDPSPGKYYWIIVKRYPRKEAKDERNNDARRYVPQK